MKKQVKEILWWYNFIEIGSSEYYQLKLGEYVENYKVKFINLVVKTKWYVDIELWVGDKSFSNLKYKFKEYDYIKSALDYVISNKDKIYNFDYKMIDYIKMLFVKYNNHNKVYNKLENVEKLGFLDYVRLYNYEKFNDVKVKTIWDNKYSKIKFDNTIKKVVWYESK